MPILQSSGLLIRQLDLYSPFFLSILLLISIFLLHKYLLGTKHKNEYLKFPPSPPKLPIIGNLHQLSKLPHRSLQALSEKHGPLMLLNLGQVQTLVVSSAEMIEEIVKQHDIAFSNRPNGTAPKLLFYGCANFGFAPYGEYWRKARKICVSQLLSNKRVESFKFVREAEVASLILNIRRRSCSDDGLSRVNLSEMLLATSLNIIAKCVVGKKGGDGVGKLAELLKQYVSLLLDLSFGDLFPFMGWVDVVTGLVRRSKAAFHEMDAFLDSMIEEKRRTNLEDIDSGHDEDEDEKEKDFVQIFLHLEKKGGLGFSQENIKGILLDLFVGAVETTATTMEWAMAELMKNPAIMKKAQEEVRRVVGRKGKVDEDDINQMDYLKCIVKETLRLHPPVPLNGPREISAPIKLKGYDILPKTRVFVNIWAIQKDPKLWDKPEVFLPERFENNPTDFRGQDFEFIPFGVGRKGCPGISFAVAILEFELANLLYWFDWKLPGDNTDHQTLDMTEAFGLAAYKKFPLQLVPIHVY